MKKLLATLLLAAFLSPAVISLTGCDAPTMVLTPQDRNQKIRRNINFEARELVEDWDSLWMVDKPSQLTRWYLPNPD
ncbi:MAG: hypothetical protein BIFFINMI_01178 [Phycisphaerae bacterium]|nr:hypothetical protein [Phycisphaerae bacterium]